MKMNMKMKTTAIAAGLALSASAAMAAGPGAGSTPYEVWASDQSNSEAGVALRGVSGSYIWIWNSEDVGEQIENGTPAQPVGCDGNNIPGDGPCDLYDVFPGSLAEHDGSALTGEKLRTLPNFGRLHGMIADPQNKYMNINLFAPGGGYVGIMDGRSKKAIALFRVSQTSAPAGGRSLHMSFWNADGSALLLANLHGRILERIDVTRDVDGNITSANFNRAASVSVADIEILDKATAFTGHGMVSTVSGDYSAAGLSATTPSGALKQGPGRGGNVVVCPIVAESGNTYITFGGGGLLVADSNTEPMAIVAEYTNDVLNGAGCGGMQIGNTIYLNAGASASGAGETQSVMTIYAIDDSAIAAGSAPNVPTPTLIYRDDTNTATGGATEGDASNLTGQIPGETTRRDAHGMARTLDGAYIHQADRVQNVVEVIDTASMSRIGSYDLTSANGQGSGQGACAAASVTDDAGLPGNDPAPDLMDTTPDGKYLVVATRGPTPVSVTHSAQGSCPGVGIIGLKHGGSTGKLLTVLRTTNTLDTAPQSAPGGYEYTGAEHSDPHGASVRVRVEDKKGKKK